MGEVFVIIEKRKNDRRRILYAILYEILIGTGKMIAAHKIEHFLQIELFPPTSNGLHYELKRA